MSTDRQRVKRAIQRIAVQAPELRSFLEDAESKGGKPKSAGVGGGSGSGGGDAQEKRVCCDGSVSDDGNPGVEERDPDSGGQDGGLNGDDPARLGSGEGTLSGVTDCATGEPICFDGAGFIPPDGWDDPTTPPVDPEYQDGYAWAVSSAEGFSSPDCFANTPSASADCKVEQLSNSPSATGDAEIVLFLQTSVSQYSLIIDARLDSQDFRFEYVVNITDCESLPSEAGDESFTCTEDPPTVDQWPEDGCTNLAIVGGSIVGSKFDPENDGSYSTPRDSIALCDGDGNEIELSPAASGGWKTINSTSDSGYLYDSKGKVIAHIDGNEYSDPAI